MDINNRKVTDYKMLKAYAYQNNLTTLLRSSSGGAFSAIVSTCFQEGLGGTVVYGAAFDEQLNVVHKRVDNLSDSCIFNGSKYAQSDIGGCFLSVENDLKNGKNVLFSGTPCQVNALLTFLRNKKCPTDHLFTIDILCHGTPSARLWADYRHWLEKHYGSRLVEFSFRYKGDGTKKRMQYPMYAKFENGKVLEDTYLLRLYKTLYFSGLAYRDSCYNCRFSSAERCGDITIGDFWQYEEAMGKKTPDNGVSLMLINTEKGIRVAESMADEDVYMEECDVDRLIAVQSSFGANTERNAAIDTFRNDYKNHGIECVLKKYAGYNSKGHLKHILKKGITVTGLMPMVKSFRGK